LIRADPKTARINVLAGVRPDDVDAVRSIMSAFVADAADFAEIPEQAKFFLSGAIELGTAVVLRVLELGEPTLEAAARYFYNPDYKNEAQFAEMLRDASRIGYVRETGAKFANMDPRLRSSIVATVTQRFDVFRTSGVANATSTSDFNPQLLRQRTATLYLVVREADQTEYAPLMRMVLTWLLGDLTAAIPPADAREFFFQHVPARKIVGVNVDGDAAPGREDVPPDEGADLRERFLRTVGREERVGQFAAAPHLRQRRRYGRPQVTVTTSVRNDGDPLTTATRGPFGATRY
jgi:hypothetical protein